MRTLMFLAAVAIGLAAMGVIHFQKDGDKVDISIDENKLRDTTGRFVREGEVIVTEAEQAAAQNGQQQQQSFGQQMESEVQTEAHRFIPQQQQQ